MPKLWEQTIEAHRREVRDAILDTTVRLVSEHGLRAVTMSQIAEETGIGRATLYKYFPDVEAILIAWHERQIRAHLGQLADIADRHDDPWARLEAVFAFCAQMIHKRPQGTDLATLVHRGEQFGHAQRQLSDLVRDLLVEGVNAGLIRDDVPPEELTAYCLHALTAAGELPSHAAVQRLVSAILAGLRPPS